METRSTSEAGFTLVEVLVSIFIFSLISVGAMVALNATLDARDGATERMERAEEIAAMHRVLSDDFAAAVDRQNRDGLGGRSTELPILPGRDWFEVTRRGRPNPNGVFPRGDLQRIVYRVEEGKLIRAFYPHENPAYIEEPVDRILLDGVSELDVVSLPETLSVERIGELLEDSTSSDAGFALSVNSGLDGSVRLDLSGLKVRIQFEDGTVTQHIFEAPA